MPVPLSSTVTSAKSPSAVDSRDLEQVVDQTHHVVDLPLQHRQDPVAGPAAGARQAQDVQAGADGCERVAQLVGERREELVLAAVCVPQRLLVAATVGDVVEEDGHLPVLGIADAEGVDVVVAPEGIGGELEAFGHAGGRDAAVDLVPLRLVVRSDGRHRAAHRVVDAGLPLEGLVHLDEDVVAAVAVVIEEEADDAVALIDGVEQRAVAQLADLQGLFGEPTLGDVLQEAPLAVAQRGFRLAEAGLELADVGLGVGDWKRHGHEASVAC